MFNITLIKPTGDYGKFLLNSVISDEESDMIIGEFQLSAINSEIYLIMSDNKLAGALQLNFVLTETQLLDTGCVALKLISCFRGKRLERLLIHELVKKYRLYADDGMTSFLIKADENNEYAMGIVKTWKGSPVKDAMWDYPYEYGLLDLSSNMFYIPLR